MNLPSLPSGWEYRPIKRVADLRFSSVDKLSLPDEEPVRLCNYLDVYRNDRITASLDFMNATATPSERMRFALSLGDVLLTKDSEDPLDIGIPACVVEPLPGILCGYHLAMLRPHPNTMDGRFLHRTLTASGVRDQFFSKAAGVTRFGLGLGDVGDSVVPVPPLWVQRAIAAFLDRKTAAIDAFIQKKERLIELLQEKRQALITQAVTKGLDPNVPMKDSGIEWLGKIPAHWVVKRLKYGFSFMKGRNSQELTASFIAEHPGDYSVFSGQTEDDGLMGTVDSYSFDTPEAIFTTTVGARVMTARVVGGKFSLSQNCLIMVPVQREKICVPFFYYQMEPLFRFERAGIPSFMQPSLRVLDLQKYDVAYPPPVEQKKVAEMLLAHEQKIQRMAAKISQQLDRLREYRQALISAAVTGKIEIPVEEAA